MWNQAEFTLVKELSWKATVSKLVHSELFVNSISLLRILLKDRDEICKIHIPIQFAVYFTLLHFALLLGKETNIDLNIPSLYLGYLKLLLSTCHQSEIFHEGLKKGEEGRRVGERNV